METSKATLSPVKRQATATAEETLPKETGGQVLTITHSVPLLHNFVQPRTYQGTSLLSSFLGSTL